MRSHHIPFCLFVLFTLSIVISLPISSSTAGAADTIDLGSRRELFVDHFLIDKLEGAALALNRPKDEGVVLKFDKPWEGPFAGYVTILRDGDKYRMYYRGLPTVDKYGRGPQVTCT
ncbi:MAG: hypothetical protein U9N87_08950, partial [Planctomycetota bacterium]|nr:hypothetical protein [Planctomycetota bacterium]